jgi:hypothetical protein
VRQSPGCHFCVPLERFFSTWACIPMSHFRSNEVSRRNVAPRSGACQRAMPFGKILVALPAQQPVIDGSDAVRNSVAKCGLTG